jgi:predicted transcriptional regulator
VPPLRLLILDDLAQHPASTTTDVQRRVDKPRSTVDRQLQSLHALGLLIQTDPPEQPGAIATRGWRYSLAPDVDPKVLVVPSPEK